MGIIELSMLEDRGVKSCPFAVKEMGSKKSKIRGKICFFEKSILAFPTTVS
jgi:hypothetical protein